jgi:hypothetical protein
MAARHLWNTTLEVADSDVQDSAIVVGKNTQSISIVTNNDNNNHVSAQIEGMLAGVVCTVNSIQIQNEKTNEELVAKLRAESHQLADRTTEQLQQEITKIKEAICQLREETRNADTNKQMEKEIVRTLSDSINPTVSLKKFHLPY